jgi:hypothetical protein
VAQAQTLQDRITPRPKCIAKRSNVLLRFEICAIRLLINPNLFRQILWARSVPIRIGAPCMIPGQHSFAIERLGRRSGWFKPDRYRFYCIRCHWMFLVEGQRVCALNDSCVPLTEPENGRRVASFALGPCTAMPLECLMTERRALRTHPTQKITTLLPSIGTAGQTRPIAWLKSVSFPKPNVMYLWNRTRSSPQRWQKLKAR